MAHNNGGRDWNDAGEPRIPYNHQKLRGSYEIQSPSQPPEGTNVVALSNLKKFERINFFCFEPSSLWSLVTAVLENEFTQ
jgi:hypothetical protein